MPRQSTIPALPTQDGVNFALVKNWPGYAVSDDGRVWSCRTRYRDFDAEWRILKPYFAHGYAIAALQKDCARLRYRVSRLILEVFVGPCPEGFQACHNNGIRSDNRLSNLRWDHPSENYADRDMHGFITRGTRHHQAKLSDEAIREIRRTYRYRSKDANVFVLAKRYGVTGTMISNILCGKNWTHVV